MNGRICSTCSRSCPGTRCSSHLIADAGFVGDNTNAALMANTIPFLIRQSCMATFKAWEKITCKTTGETLVMYRPDDQGKQGKPWLHLRLIVVVDRRRNREGKRPKPVWLLTNVLDPTRLSARQAGEFYRMRWENEGMFRTYKRTLNKLKLVNRTLRTARREAHGSLLACRLLLGQGQGAWAQHLKSEGSRKARPSEQGGREGEQGVYSPRRAILAVREGLLKAMRFSERERDLFGEADARRM